MTHEVDPLVEKCARAMYGSDPERNDEWDEDHGMRAVRDDYRRQAKAALAAVREECVIVPKDTAIDAVLELKDAATIYEQRSGLDKLVKYTRQIAADLQAAIPDYDLPSQPAEGGKGDT